jgi:Tol biopolymer transport system component
MTKHAPRFLLAAALALTPVSASALQNVIYLVSETARGQSAEGTSQGPAVNHNGTGVAYNSNALNLVSPPFQNFVNQVYLREIAVTASTLISKNTDTGQAGNLPSLPGGFAPSINADSHYIAFSSRATNLVPEDTNGFEDVFVYDRATNTMELISRGRDGAGANGVSSFPRLSADGRYVVFQSTASNLVENDGNGVLDIFVFDRQTQSMKRVSVAPDGTEANGQSLTPAISGDGRYVAFASRATNLVDTTLNGRFEQIFLTEWETGAIQLASVNEAGQAANAISFLPALTTDGGTVAFKSEAFNLVPGDTNGVPDVFVRVPATDLTQRVSVDSFGNQSNGLSAAPGISGDGRFVAFASFSSTFVPDDGNGLSDVYVYDRFPPNRSQGLIARVTVAIGGGEPNGGVSDFPVSVSSDGRWIGFASSASNLVPDDFNNSLDAFLGCNPFDEFECAPPTPTPTQGTVPCVGDCSGDGMVTIDDLIRMVNIALGLQSVCGTDGVGQCLAGDANCDCEITVDEIIRAVQNSLNGCQDYGDCSLEEHAEICCGGPIETATPTPTPPPGEPTDTPTLGTPTGTVTATITPTSGPAGPCVGDCTGNGEVTIDELIKMVNIALGIAPLCGSNGCLAGDAVCDCEITVDDIIDAVNNSLNGCTTFGDCTLQDHELQCCAV